jgi:hypothetical protein
VCRPAIEKPEIGRFSKPQKTGRSFATVISFGFRVVFTCFVNHGVGLSSLVDDSRTSVQPKPM